MLLKNIFKKPLLGFEQQLHNYEADTFMYLIGSIKLKQNPACVFHEFFIDKDSKYKQLDDEWFKSINHKLLEGKKIHSIFVNQLPKFNLIEYAKTTFNFNIRYYNGEFIKYTYNKFISMAKIAISMYIAKYGYDNFYYFEFRTIIVRLLFKYFCCSEEVIDIINGNYYIWVFNSDEIINAIIELENCELDVFLNLIKTYNMLTPNKKNVIENTNVQKFKVNKNPSREELMSLFTDNMTQKEKYHIIMKTYDIKTVSTARRILRQANLTRTYNSKKHLEEIKDEIINNDNKNTEILKKRIEVLENQIEDLKKNIIKQKNIEDELLYYKQLMSKIYNEMKRYPKIGWPPSILEYEKISNNTNEIKNE